MNTNLKTIFFSLSIVLSTDINAHPLEVFRWGYQKISPSTHSIESTGSDYDISGILDPYDPHKHIEFDDVHKHNVKEAQVGARIQALRLLATMKHPDLIDQKKYTELERIILKQARDLKIESYNQHISFDSNNLMLHYAFYANSNQDLPQRTKERHLKEKNKKQVAAHEQALRLTTVIGYSKLMNENNFSKLEDITHQKAIKLNKTFTREYCDENLPTHYGIYSQNNFILNNKFAQSKNIK